MNNVNEEEILSGESRRLKQLSGLGIAFLRESKLLLDQFKRGGITLYPIMENDIKGLTNTQITNVYLLLNRVYDNIVFDYTDARYNEQELVRDSEGKHIKTLLKMKLGSDAVENLVFSIAEIKDAGMGGYERCFVEGQMLSLAVKEVEKVLAEDKKFLTLKGDIFLYNGERLSVGSDTHVYRLLKSVYDCSDGLSGNISYNTLFESLRSWDKYKLLSDENLKALLTKYISSEKSELGMKLKSVESNGLKLIDTNRGAGINFNNG